MSEKNGTLKRRDVMPERRKVRCKMECRSNNEQSEGEHKLHLSVVYDGSEENDRFFSLTPAGYLALEVVSPETASFFEVGREYFIDIIPADANES